MAKKNYPLVRIDQDNIIELENCFIEIFQVESKNIFTLQETSKNIKLESFNKLINTFKDDIKILIVNTPFNTLDEQEHIHSQIRNCTNDLYLSFLNDKLNDLMKLDEEREETKYFIMLFDSSKEKLLKKIDKFKRVFKISFFYLSSSEKEQLLYKLSNKNYQCKECILC